MPLKLYAPTHSSAGAPHTTDRSAQLFAWLSKLQSARSVYTLCAFLLLTPSLFSGFALDDFVLLSQFVSGDGKEWGGSAPLDLFRWLDPHSTPRMMDGAGLAWWTYPLTRFALLRPVSSLTHAFDYALWPHNAVLMHLHSLAWFALLWYLVSKWYAVALDDRWARGVATAMFALDGAHGTAIGWISNRNALVSSVFGVLTLLCHQRWRTGHNPRAALGAWLCFTLCLFAGELGLGCLGYLLAYALFMEASPARHRALSLVPYLAITAVWILVRMHGGYGVYGMGAYVDPTREPLAFLRIAPGHLLILLASQWLRFSADATSIAPASAHAALALIAGALLTLVGAFAWPVLRERPFLRFLALGSCLSALPLTASGQPCDRLLVLTGVGVFPVLAQALARVLRAGVRSSAGERALARGLVVLHLAVAPCMLLALSLVPALISHAVAAVDESMPENAALAAQTAFVTSVPDSAYLGYLRARRAVEGRTRPERLYWLAASAAQGSLERRSERELHMICDDGCFDAQWSDRSARLPLHAGETIQLSQLNIHIEAVTRDGRPAVCDLSFAQPLESSAYRWFTWQQGKLAPWSLPHIGERVALHGN